MGTSNLLISLVLFLLVAVGSIYFIQKFSGLSHPRLVSGFPQIPQIPNSVLLDSRVTTDGTTNPVFAANWKTSHSVSFVMNWYIRAFQQAGWEVDQTANESSEETWQYVTASLGDLVVNLDVEKEEDYEPTIIFAEILSQTDSVTRFVPIDGPAVSNEHTPE